MATDEERFWEQVDEPCGHIFELEGADIVGDGNYRRKVPDVQLVCSLPFGHRPVNRHSDGVNEWLGDDE